MVVVKASFGLKNTTEGRQSSVLFVLVVAFAYSAQETVNLFAYMKSGPKLKLGESPVSLEKHI